MNVEESDITSLNFQYGEEIFDPVRCKSKQFYELLISKKTIVSRGFTKLNEDFDLDNITVSKAFLKTKTVSSETFIRSFQFKFLDDIIYTNVRLAKIVMSHRTLALFAKLIQKRSSIYFINVRSQIFFFLN